MRTDYFLSMLIAYLVIDAALCVLTIGYYWIIHSRWITVAPEVVVPGLTLTLLLLALVSLSAGAWLSTASRLQPDSPEVLATIFSSTLVAPARAIIVVAFGFLAILLLYKRVIVFAFGGSGSGGFTTSSVLTTLTGAILTGGFLGLGEALLPEAVIQRSANLIAALTPR